MRAWILRNGRVAETTTDWISSMRRAREIGARVAARARAEGAVLFHGADSSWWARRDGAGRWTSAALSDGLKAAIRAHREELRLWAAEERADMRARAAAERRALPRLGSSEVRADEDPIPSERAARAR